MPTCIARLCCPAPQWALRRLSEPLTEAERTHIVWESTSLISGSLQPLKGPMQLVPPLPSSTNKVTLKPLLHAQGVTKPAAGAVYL